MNEHGLPIKDKNSYSYFIISFAVNYFKLTEITGLKNEKKKL